MFNQPCDPDFIRSSNGKALLSRWLKVQLAVVECCPDWTGKGSTEQSRFLHPNFLQKSRWIDILIGYTAHRRIIRENRAKLERLLPGDGLSEVRAHCERPKEGSRVGSFDPADRVPYPATQTLLQIGNIDELKTTIKRYSTFKFESESRSRKQERRGKGKGPCGSHLQASMITEPYPRGCKVINDPPTHFHQIPFPLSLSPSWPFHPRIAILSPLVGWTTQRPHESATR